MNIEDILEAKSVEDALPSHDIPHKAAQALPQLNGAELFRAAVAMGFPQFPGRFA